MQNKSLLQSLRLPILFVLIIWSVHIFTTLLSIDVTNYGIYPRKWDGIKGVLFYAFIHGDWGHLISNTTPLFVLSALVLYFYRRIAIPAFLMIYFLSGIAVWMFARPAYHIGASGFIYGLVAFVFWNGIFRRNIRSIALALIIVFYYGSMVFGVLPINPRVSWEGHLFGALAGVLASYWFMDFIEKEEQRPTYSWENEPAPEEKYFLDRNTFEETKTERNARSGSNFWTSTRT